ncbi:hypothetical protein [Falsiroseomonas selenitidurans]|uniref:DNA primase n=1 Tax=Falsiroseomonas selenitidurans TaxID=2716335 RepID=A0ABX1ED78_9PROT|nr:hypothetical protein [Falsiroseomonas selenitidurans]NKC33487.1 hypothetical protein [Falsiroseomonas selenitidurans]
MTARVIRPAFGGATAPRPPEDDIPFDREVTGPAPAPPDDDDRPGGGGGGGGPPGAGGAEDGAHFGPVVPIGVTTRKGATAYALLDANGLQVVHSARDLYQRAVIKSLFGGQSATEFLIGHWPLPPRGKRASPTDYDAELVGDALMSACSAAGHAGAVELRLDGVWPHGKGVLFHAGTEVLLPGPEGRWDEARRPGFRDGRAIYVFAPERREPPAAEPALRAEVADLEEAFRMWAFASPVGPQVLVGLVCCGLLGAAIPWRPHVFLRGVKDAGKSTLARLVAAACGAGEPSTDITAAGLKRQFDGRSGLIPLDEREADARGVKQIVEIMRGSSDGEGSKSAQTALDGGVQVFRVAGSFLLAAITLPSMTDADASRITLLHLRRPEARQRADLDAAMQLARDLHPKLLARALGGHGRWRENWQVARQVAQGMEGTSRSADQIGALVAGWWTLARDGVMAPDKAREVMAPYEEFLTTRSAAEFTDTGFLVLQHLLGSRIAVFRRSSDQLTVQSAIIASLRAQVPLMSDRLHGEARDMAQDQARAWDRRLGSVGLRAVFDPHGSMKGWPFPGARTAGLLIGQAHSAMRAVFHGSPWPDEAWRGPLLDLPGAQLSRGPVSFAHGGQSRAVFVPLVHLGIDDADLVGVDPVDP